MDNPNFWFFLVLSGISYIYVIVNKEDSMLRRLSLFACILCLLAAIDYILY